MIKALLSRVSSLKYALASFAVVGIVVATGGIAHADTEQYTYSGHLFSDTGVPLANATLQLGPSNAYHTLTDANGAFSISAPPAGNYTVNLFYNRSVDGVAVPIVPGGPQELFITRAAPLDLTADKTEDLIIPFVPLTLKTTDYTNNPVANIPLEAKQLSSKDQYLGPNPVLTPQWYGAITNRATSNASGEATLQVMQGSIYSCAPETRINANFSDGFANGCGGVGPFITQATTLTLQQGTPQTPRDVVQKGGQPNNTPYITWAQNTNGYSANHYDVYRDGTKIGSPTASAYIDYAAPEGEHHYAIKAVGSNGAASELSQEVVEVIDKTPPVLSNASLGGTAIPPGGTLAFSVDAADPYLYPLAFPNNGRAEYFIDTDPGEGHGTPVNFSTFYSDHVTIADSITTNLPPGQHTFFIRASDNFGNAEVPTTGNWSQPAALAFNVVLPSPTGLTTAHAYTNQAPTFQWSAVAGADHYVIYRDGSPVGSSPTASFTDTSSLSEGAHAYTVSAVLGGGAQSNPSSPLTITYDLTPPSQPSVAWANNPMLHTANGSGPAATLSVQAHDALSPVQKVEYSIDGGARQSMGYDSSAAAWRASFDSTRPVGAYNFAIFVTDAAGNESQPTTDMLAVYDPANGYIKGHETLTPSASDVLPIARDTSGKPTKLDLDLTKVKAAGPTFPASGKVNIQYVIKNNRDEFNVDSSNIDWLVVLPDGKHASILAHGDLTTYIGGTKHVTQHVGIRIDLTLGANNAPDHVAIGIYAPGTNPTTGSPTWTIADDATGNVKVKS